MTSRVMLGKPVLCTLPPPRASVSLFPLRASWLNRNSLCRPSTVSERQKSHAGQRQAGPSCSACKQPPLPLARPCCPRCMCWTWNLGATSSRTWTASRWAQARALELPAGGGPARLEADWPPCPLFQFCGATIAGLSLLSPSVMRLVHTQEPGEWLELLLEPGSLYILRYSPHGAPQPSNSSDAHLAC